MSKISPINSDTYWNRRFSQDWETCEGPRQSRFFAQLAIENLPSWLIQQLRRQSLTLADWGCAQGDGTNVWASYVDPHQLLGVDFSGVAIEQAIKRYPAIRFEVANWLEGNVGDGESYDIVFSSNTLEHFHAPYKVLESLSARAKKAVVLALPYRELNRIDEHFYTFLPENIPIELSNGFRLLWSKVVDCSYIPDPLWGGDQIFLLYAQTSWVDSLKLTLEDCEVQQNDTTSTIASLNQDVAARDRQIVCLNGEVEVRDGQITSLFQDLAERDGQITSMFQDLAERDGQITSMFQDLAERDGQITSMFQLIAERDGQIVSLSQAVSERDGQITSLSQVVSERDGQIASLSQAVSERDERIMSLNQIGEEHEQQIRAFISSRSWRLTRPLRVVRRMAGALKFKKAADTTEPATADAVEPMAADIEEPAAADAVEHHLSGSGAWVMRANQAERVAIIPCGFEFNELVNQRPINAAKYLADKGYFVLFVPWQWSPQDVLSKGCSEVWPNVYQVPLFDFISGAERLSSSSNGDNFSLFWITMPARVLVELIPTVRQRGFVILYDIMDDWEAFSLVGQAAWYDPSAEASVVMQSDYVCAVSTPLRDKFSNLRSDIGIFGNGYMPDVIGLGNRGVAASQRKSELIVGYFGHLTDAWFDWDLVFALARKRPDISFEIIGYGEPDWVVSEASALPNVRRLGTVLPIELHRYASRWSAAIIPFVEGNLASAVDPIKIYEYLYFGLPTIVTGIPHLQDYPMTYFARRENVHEVIDLAIHSECDREELDSFLQETTWSARFDALIGQVEKNQNFRLLYAN